MLTGCRILVIIMIETLRTNTFDIRTLILIVIRAVTAENEGP
jgi:hypothetical protein